MGTLTYPYSLTAGQPENVNQLNSNLTAIANVLNGNVDSANITDGTITAADLVTAVQAAAGLNGASTRRGKSIIATEEARTNTAYGLLTTADRVSNIVMPTDGLLCVAFEAQWKESVAGAARAALFLGANQLKLRDIDNSGATTQAAMFANTGGLTNTYGVVSSSPIGLVGLAPQSGDVAQGDSVTTGQLVGFYDRADAPGHTYMELGGGSINVDNNTDGAYRSCHVGGAMLIFAAAGTYDISVQFKASSGSVTAKNRKLWAWSMGFD